MYILDTDTLSHLHAGNENVIRAIQSLEYAEITQIEIISITPAAADQLAQLTANSKLRKIGRADLIIASITLAQRAILVTHNLRHFKQIPGLTAINWVD